MDQKMNNGFDPLSSLAHAYEAEDSQTITHIDQTEIHSGIHSEESFIEDTVIQNHDTYIDRLIASNPNFVLSPQSTAKYDDHMLSSKSVAPFSSKTTPRNRPRISTDFLMVVDNLQKELNERNKEIGQLKEQRNTSQKNYEKLSKINKNLNESMQSAENENNKNKQSLMEKNLKIDTLQNEINAKNEQIKKLSAEIEKYEYIATWIDLQMDKDKYGKNGKINELSIEKLMEWKESIIEKQEKFHSIQYDDEKEVIDENSNLLQKKTKKKKQKKSIKKEAEKDDEIENEIENNQSCCVPWFNV